MRKVRKNGTIELLRFLFAIGIMAFHYPFDSGITETAQIGVEFFYIIMGIFMAQKIASYSGDSNMLSTGEYIIKKILSFYKYFIPAFIIEAVIMAINEEMSLFSILDRIVISIPQLLFLNSLGFHSDTYGGAIYVPASWFSSSAVIGLLIIFPMAKKNWNTFVEVIAPIIIGFSAGYLYLNFGTIFVHYNFIGGVNVALLRTFMDLSLGCMAFVIATKIEGISKNNKTIKILEWLLYVVVFMSIVCETPRTVEIPMLFCLTVAVALTMSTTNNSSFFNNQLSYYLGRLSAPLYLLHYTVIQGMMLVFDNINTADKFILFNVVAVALSMLCMYVIEHIEKKWKSRKKVQE